LDLKLGDNAMAIDENLKYEFAPTSGGDESGYHDSVSTTFNTNIPSAVARESLQNSIDAGIANPVRVEFSLLKITPNEIPNVSQLSEIVQACKEFFPNNHLCVEFYENIQTILSKARQIYILKISDYNPRGLTGGNDERTGDYYSFLKSTGASAKGKDQGGSFGLGKGSLFAASALRTIFVSSVYDGNKYVFQGKLRLVSHEIDGKVKQGNGSFGLAEQLPVRDERMIPNLFKREKQGTDIYILGFLDHVNWKEDIIRSVLNNFWYAIEKGDLIVDVGDVRIETSSLELLMHKYFDDPQIAADGKENPFYFYEAYKHSSALFEDNLDTLGPVKLFILLKEGLPKRVAYFRKAGMLVEAKRYNYLESYAGVFICENDQGNEILRKMEPPTHNQWAKDSPNAKSPDGITLPEIIRADKELKNFIKDSLRKLNPVDKDASLGIQGLSEYLYLPEEEGAENTPEGSRGGIYDNKPATYETGVKIGRNGNVSPPPLSTEPFKPIKTRTLGVVGEGPAFGAGEGSGPGPGPGGIDEPGGGGAKPAKVGGGQDSVRILANMKFRSFSFRDSSDLVWHMMLLRGDPLKKCKIYIEAGTDIGFETVSIVEARNVSGVSLPVSGNLIKNVELNSQGEARISLKFDSNDRYALKAVAYEIR
jgi:hypothetical protein